MSSEIDVDIPTVQGYVVAYADGSCSKNALNKSKAAYGVWFYDNCPYNIGMPLEGVVTNMRAEIAASTAALEIIHKLGYDKAKIYTDSIFILNCVNGWLDKWKANGWKKTNNKPVQNCDVLLKFDCARSPFSDIKWEHVNSHTGYRGNEEAHKLAREAIEKIPYY